MITFGKEINNRPINLGLFFGIVAGIIAATGTVAGISEINSIVFIVGIVVLIVTFLFTTVVYYGTNLEADFYYWTVSNKEITYYDLSTFSNRVKTIFLKHNMPKKTVKLSDIKKISTHGLDAIIDKSGYDRSYLATQYIQASLMQRAKNPKAITLYLKDGSEVTLDLARDFQSDPVAAKTKLLKVFDLIKQN
ncbi:hypothetical protein [Companilactobacillus hulinensis]|uniref:hypothetical protein n=1 Tax=Companilactobacillus hulinensis TaxID=2486007 RepID=UPI000F790AE5|nr:hypothetical protein [Companilactobacillus hulinensis]